MKTKHNTLKSCAIAALSILSAGGAVAGTTLDEKVSPDSLKQQHLFTVPGYHIQKQYAQYTLLKKETKPQPPTLGRINIYAGGSHLPPGPRHNSTSQIPSAIGPLHFSSEFTIETKGISVELSSDKFLLDLGYEKNIALGKNIFEFNNQGSLDTKIKKARYTEEIYSTQTFYTPPLKKGLHLAIGHDASICKNTTKRENEPELKNDLYDTAFLIGLRLCKNNQSILATIGPRWYSYGGTKGDSDVGITSKIRGKGQIGPLTIDTHLTLSNYIKSENGYTGKTSQTKFIIDTSLPAWKGLSILAKYAYTQEKSSTEQFSNERPYEILKSKNERKGIMCGIRYTP